jgi:hypothetical protein
MSTTTDSQADQNDNEPNENQEVESGESSGVRRPGDRLDGFADKRARHVVSEVSEE